jgi:hypothetical protein
MPQDVRTHIDGYIAALEEVLGDEKDVHFNSVNKNIYLISASLENI